MVTTNQKIRRLPGFRFEAQTSMREDVLPRMDIAVFIGFAASGPIDVPVVLESADDFKAIFGADLPLVWDQEKGETIYAFLAPTVRSFFRNGGKRCWVIRLARTKPKSASSRNRACTNFFPLEGFAGFDFDEDEIAPVLAQARSRGSWSDNLQIGTAVLSKSVKLHKFNNSNKTKIIELEISTEDKIEKNELIRLNFEKEGVALLLSADEIVPQATVYKNKTSTPELKLKKKIVRFTSKNYIWIQNLPEFKNKKNAGKVLVNLWTRQHRLNSTEILKTSHFSKKAIMIFQQSQTDNVGKTNGKVILHFDNLTAGDAPSAGSLLTARYQNKHLCLQVEAVNVKKSGANEKVEVLCQAVYLRKNLNKPSSAPNTERLSFEFWVKKDTQSLLRLSELAFNSGHERFWGNLPTDEEIHRYGGDSVKEIKIPGWTQNSDAQTFPLAGNESKNLVYFPIFPTASPQNYLGAIPLLGSKLERDGLAKFEIELFLDEKLKNTELNNLLNDAEFIRFLSPNARPLHGVHAALAPETVINTAVEGLPTNRSSTSISLEEATIICVPDAIHRGWFLKKDNREILPPLASKPPLRPEWWTFECAGKIEVKAVSEPLWENFLNCGIRILKKPENLQVKEETISGGKYTLIWESDEADSEIEFVLEESASRDFSFSNTIYRGKLREFFVSERKSGIYYYRVRAQIGKNISDWSDGFAVQIPLLENWQSKTSDKFEPDVLFAVQRAILRMSAARGDLFAIFDLPEHFDKNDAVSHIAVLKTTKGLTVANFGVEPFNADELKALSYGAVYHPWLLTRENDSGTVRNIPPSGSMCGVMAQRALRRGVWIAPANEALQGVLGLNKSFRREEFFDFQDNLVNLVRNEPTGFTVLDADTLSDDFDLRSINVRRLLSLLRRLALKHGAEYVFEPNDERFRRQVQRGFSSLLDGMFARGAFAGTTPATSYQVVVSETLNNLQSVEQGRFIVELKVAPSLPLKFVNVRLVQIGGRSSVTEVF